MHSTYVATADAGFATQAGAIAGQQDSATRFAGLGNHGFGYAQMIIPKDGSEPYLHYYDHNYENLNNIGDVSATGGILQTSKAEIPQEGAGVARRMGRAARGGEGSEEDRIHEPCREAD